MVSTAVTAMERTVVTCKLQESKGYKSPVKRYQHKTHTHPHRRRHQRLCGRHIHIGEDVGRTKKHLGENVRDRATADYRQEVLTEQHTLLVQTEAKGDNGRRRPQKQKISNASASKNTARAIFVCSQGGAGLHATREPQGAHRPRCQGAAGDNCRAESAELGGERFAELQGGQARRAD